MLEEDYINLMNQRFLINNKKKMDSAKIIRNNNHLYNYLNLQNKYMEPYQINHKTVFKEGWITLRNKRKILIRKTKKSKIVLQYLMHSPSNKQNRHAAKSAKINWLLKMSQLVSTLPPIYTVVNANKRLLDDNSNVI